MPFIVHVHDERCVVRETDRVRLELDQERALIRPPVTVALGATAARSVTTLRKTLRVIGIYDDPQLFTGATLPPPSRGFHLWQEP